MNAKDKSKNNGGHFSSFGLDNNKKSRDSGSKGEKFCPWSDLPPDPDNGYTGHNVSVGMSMCFAHFVICLDCATAAFDLSNLHKWANNECFKCKQKDLSCYHMTTITKYPSDDIAICRECAELAIKVLSNHKQCLKSN